MVAPGCSGAAGCLIWPDIIASFAPTCADSDSRRSTSIRTWADVEALIALSRVASKVDVSGYLARVQVPTLGLYPTAGVVTGVEEEQIRRSIPGIRIVNLPTRFHAIQVLMPATCATQVLHFAAQHDGIPCREL